VRKVRSNKGVARGPQAGVLQRRMNRNASRMAARRAAGPVVRKVRANKGVARVPAARKMAKLITPTEAELYNMIFGSPMPRRRPAAKKPAAKKAAARKASPAKRRVSPLRMTLRSRRVK
jgi:hypothetical protein